MKRLDWARQRIGGRAHTAPATSPHATASDPIQRELRNRELTWWPAIAAGLASLLGMGSCAISILPFSGQINAAWAAPLLGLVSVGALFRVLLPLRASATTAEGQRSEIHLATAASWIVTIAAAVTIGAVAQETFVKTGAPRDIGIYLIALFVGATIGGLFARITFVVGNRYFRRKREKAGAKLASAAS